GALAYAADGDVAVGDHADEAVALADRQDTGIDLGHDLRGPLDGIVGRNHTHVARHALADLHRNSPCRHRTGFACWQVQRLVRPSLPSVACACGPASFSTSPSTVLSPSASRRSPSIA